MRTFIKTKFKKSDDKTNIDKYRVKANITKLIFLRIIIPKFMNIRKLFHVCKNVKIGLWTFWSQL